MNVISSVVSRKPLPSFESCESVETAVGDRRAREGASKRERERERDQRLTDKQADGEK